MDQMKIKRFDKTNYLFLIAALLLTVCFAFSSIYIGDMLERNIHFRLSEMLTTHRSGVLSGLSSQRNALDICAQVIEEHEGSLEHSIGWAPTILQNLTKADAVALTDIDGKGLLTTGDEIDISDSEVYKMISSGEGYAVCVGRTSPEADITFLMARMIEKDGAPAMILAASYAVEDVCDYLLRSSMPTDGCVLMGTDGNVLLRAELNQAGGIAQTIREADPANAKSADTLEKMFAQDGSGTIVYRSYGEKWYFSFAELGVNDWKIGFSVRAVELDYMGTVISALQWTLYGLSMAVVIGFGLKYMSDEDRRGKQRRLEDANREERERKPRL